MHTNTMAGAGPVDQLVRPANEMQRAAEFNSLDMETKLRYMATSRLSPSLAKTFTDAADEIARLKTIAEMAVSAERERCAKLCDDSNIFDYQDPGGFFAALIRGLGPNVEANRPPTAG